MPSPKIIELEKTLQNYSLEDKHWLLQQLIQQVGLNPQKYNLASYKQQAKELIAQTISEVSNLDEQHVLPLKYYHGTQILSPDLFLRRLKLL